MLLFVLDLVNFPDFSPRIKVTLSSNMSANWPKPLTGTKIENDLRIRKNSILLGSIRWRFVNYWLFLTSEPLRCPDTICDINSIVWNTFCYSSVHSLYFLCAHVNNPHISHWIHLIHYPSGTKGAHKAYLSRPIGNGQQPHLTPGVKYHHRRVLRQKLA